jgi:hypothetical protein
VKELLRLPITFRAADGSIVHSPLIAAVVDGIGTLLVLDTGSEVHVFTAQIAERAGLSLDEGEEGTDHAGTTLPSWAAGDVRMSAGGQELVLRDIVVIPAPTPFPGWGVGGILSPQHLHPNATVIIDLVADELILVDGTPGAVATWLAKRSPERKTLSLERVGRTSTPVVAAAVKSFPETAAMLNTGGRNTEFDESVLPGLAGGDAERLGGGVSGADVVGAIAGDQILVVGESEITVARLAVRRNMGYPPGLVGMNVLRGTVIAVDADPMGLVAWQLAET